MYSRFVPCGSCSSIIRTGRRGKIRRTMIIRLGVTQIYGTVRRKTFTFHHFLTH